MQLAFSADAASGAQVAFGKLRAGFRFVRADRREFDGSQQPAIPVKRRPQRETEV
jgi:hypothetical protein